MEFKDLDPHIENLLPGTIIVCEVGVLIGDGASIALPAGIDGWGLIFIAVAYGVGVVSAMVSRFILDIISESGARALVFRILAHENTVENLSSLSIGKLNEQYREAVRNVYKQNDGFRRNALARRRAQGRLIRNLAVPLILLPCVVLKVWPSGIAFWGLFWLLLGTVLLADLLVIFLYVYSELNIYAEAKDILAPGTRKGIHFLGGRSPCQ